VGHLRLSCCCSCHNWSVSAWLADRFLAGFCWICLWPVQSKTLQMVTNKQVVWRITAKLLQKRKIIATSLKNCHHWDDNYSLDSLNYHDIKSRRPRLWASNNRPYRNNRHWLGRLESSNHGVIHSSNFLPNNLAAVLRPAAMSTFGNTPCTSSLTEPRRQTKESFHAVLKCANQDIWMSSR